MERACMKRVDGFTLIEVMVAMVIMSIGLFAVLNLQIVAVRGNTFARSRTDAQKIAQGVADEIRTQALGWVRSPMGTTGWDDVFSDLPLSTTPNEDGSNLNVADLRSVLSYQGQSIAADNTPAGAQLIDVNGNQGPGAMFRVHYIAHPVRVEASAAPSPDLVRLTVFVSWDSKDHGQQDYDWEQWWGGAGENFFLRHVVTVTQFLRQRHI